MPRTESDWYHGSPLKLSTLSPGSSVTQVKALAMAFSHKPARLAVEITEDDGSGEKRVRIDHDGRKPGYLYRVFVVDPEDDLVANPDYRGSPGEEKLTKMELALELIAEVPLESTYEFTLEC